MKNNHIGQPRDRAAILADIAAVGLVIAERLAAADGQAARAKEWKKALRYFKDNRSRMKYDEYLANGWFRGSGSEIWLNGKVAEQPNPGDRIPMHCR